ncbi:MAG: hypothetical protein OQK82_00355 [Candidatus Pacearchaeota archaeon]|nr:hypothetical protein [Candidatus Pacearchaeota archaeon]
MNKKGDKLISIYWFVILILVAGGISAMVIIFYGAQYDVREVEATILSNKIADCVSYKGIINENFFNEVYANNSLRNCHINFSVESDNNWDESLQYYFSVKIFNVDDLKNSKVVFGEGNKNLVSSCEIENENYDKLAKCNEERMYALGKDGEQYLIKILSIVRKSEKNVKM